MRSKFKFWNYEDMKYALDNQTVISRKQIARELNRSNLGVYSLYSVARNYQKDPNYKYMSERMKEMMYKYFHNNGNSHPKQQTPTIIEMSEALTKEVTELDKMLEELKVKVSNVIELAVEDKTKKRLTEISKELAELRQFKENVRTNSVLTQLRQHFTGR